MLYILHLYNYYGCKSVYSYLLMVLFLMLSLNLVYICVAAIAVVFIKNAGYIDSIKNKKNNKIIFIMTWHLR